jgi:hypothetical protein
MSKKDDRKRRKREERKAQNKKWEARKKQKAMHPQEKLDRDAAATTIASIKWFLYVNPVIGIKVHIQRTLIDLVARQIGDWTDAAGAIALFARPHIDRLRGHDICRLGQSEGFLEQPLKATWHVLMIDGEVYVADVEFFPYR